MVITSVLFCETILKILLVLSLVSTLCNGQTRDGDPPYQYFWQIQGCLKMHREQITWLGAWAMCLHEGGQLTAPWNHEFIAAVNELHSSDTRSPSVMFSGARVLLPPYNGGEYQSKGKKEWDLCGVWYVNGTRGEVDCKKQLPFTCFVPAAAVAPSPEHKCPTPTAIATPAPALTSSSSSDRRYENPPHIVPDPRCGERSLGYEFADWTGRCYKFQNFGARWEVANRTCVAEGGRLAVPDSTDATQVLKTLFGRFPHEYIVGAYRSHAAVGVYRDVGVWKTIDGRILDNALSEKQNPYGYINRDGSLMNWSINEFTTFICERAPWPVAEAADPGGR